MILYLETSYFYFIFNRFLFSTDLRVLSNNRFAQNELLPQQLSRFYDTVLRNKLFLFYIYKLDLSILSNNLFAQNELGPQQLWRFYDTVLRNKLFLFYIYIIQQFIRSQDELLPSYSNRRKTT